MITEKVIMQVAIRTEKNSLKIPIDLIGLVGSVIPRLTLVQVRK